MREEFIFAIDVSASMQATDTENGQTRIRVALDLTKRFITEWLRVGQSVLGCSVYLFGDFVQWHSGITAENFDRELDGADKMLAGHTLTDAALAAAFDEHKDNGATRTRLVIFTDGVPSSPEAFTAVLDEIKDKVGNDKEFRATIVIVGEPDPEFAAFCAVALKSYVEGSKFLSVVGTDDVEKFIADMQFVVDAASEKRDDTD